MNKLHYVYIFLDPRKKGEYEYNVEGKVLKFKYEPFYVGKGQGNRCYEVAHRNRFCTFKINKIQRECGRRHFIKKYSCPSHEYALEVETKLIQTIGRVDLKTGPLTNWTDGGTGGGINPSKELTEKRRKSALRRIKRDGVFSSEEHYVKFTKHMKGKKHTEETRQKMSEGQLKRANTFERFVHSMKSRGDEFVYVDLNRNNKVVRFKGLEDLARRMDVSYWALRHTIYHGNVFFKRFDYNLLIFKTEDYIKSKYFKKYSMPDECIYYVKGFTTKGAKSLCAQP